jgi:hypothetical protein
MNHPEGPIQVAARCKAWVCDRSLFGIAGSNPTGGMDACCECCVLSGRERFLGPADYMSRGILPTVVRRVI